MSNTQSKSFLAGKKIRFLLLENTFKLHLEDKVDNQEFPTYHFQDNKKFLISSLINVILTYMLLHKTKAFTDVTFKREKLMLKIATLK